MEDNRFGNSRKSLLQRYLNTINVFYRNPYFLKKLDRLESLVLRFWGMSPKRKPFPADGWITP